MADNEVVVSTRERELLEAYADHEGIEPGEALARLYKKNIENRVSFKRPRGEVRTFRLPKSD